MKPFQTETDSMGDVAPELSGLDRAGLEKLFDPETMTELGLMGASK